jgi:chromosome segregation ATPase
MMDLVKEILPYISPSALPLLVAVLGGIYIYRKIGNDRKVTKAERDQDSQTIHDELLRHKFEITELKGRTEHHETVLDDLRDQISTLTASIAELSATIKVFMNSVKGK